MTNLQNLVKEALTKSNEVTIEKNENGMTYIHVGQESFETTTEAYEAVAKEIEALVLEAQNEKESVEGTHFSTWFEVKKDKVKIFFNEIPYEIVQIGSEELGFKVFEISTNTIKKVLAEYGVSTSEKYVNGLFKKIQKIALELNK